MEPTRPGSGARLARVSERAVPVSPPRDRVRMATHVRSTWITASLDALRSRGHFAAYEPLLPEEHREAILTAVAGQWLPIEVALTHFETVSALSLPDAEMVAIGRDVAAGTGKTVLSMVVNGARAEGVTPWTLFDYLQSLWDRGCIGGGITAYKVGPSEARVEIIRWPCARVPYCRVAWRGVLQNLTLLYGSSVVVREVPRLCTATTLGYSLGWV